MNINRCVVLLIWNTHTHLCSTLVKEREVVGEGGGSVFDQSFGFYLLSFWGIYIEEYFAGFFPLGFSQDKSLCYFCMVVLIYLSVIMFICCCYENKIKYGSLS